MLGIRGGGEKGARRGIKYVCVGVVTCENECREAKQFHGRGE